MRSSPTPEISTADANDLIVRAYKAGYHARDAEVAALHRECSRLWLAAFGDRERREYLLDRLDRAAELADRDDVDDVLDETWRIYCESLIKVREPVQLNPTTEHFKEVA